MSHEVSRRELLAGVAGAFILAKTPDVGAQPTDVFTELPLSEFSMDKNVPPHVPSEIQQVQETDLPQADSTLTILTNRQRYETSPSDEPVPLRQVRKGLTELQYNPDQHDPTEAITVYLPRDARQVSIATSDAGTASNMISGISGPGEGNRYLIFSPSGKSSGPGKVLLRVR